MERNKKQSEMFDLGNLPRKKKVMTAAHKALVAMYNATPTMVVNRTPKSQQKGTTDLPLFEPKNQEQIRF